LWDPDASGFRLAVGYAEAPPLKACPAISPAGSGAGSGAESGAKGEVPQQAGWGEGATRPVRRSAAKIEVSGVRLLAPAAGGDPP